MLKLNQKLTESASAQLSSTDGEQTPTIKEKDIVPTKVVTKGPETPFEPPIVQSTGSQIILEQSENPTGTGEIDNQGKFFFSIIHF